MSEEALHPIDYEADQRHRVDLFHPAGGDRGGPVVLFIHGGDWQAFDKSSSSHLARGANGGGLTVALPSYRPPAPSFHLGQPGPRPDDRGGATPEPPRLAAADEQPPRRRRGRNGERRIP